MKHFKFLGKGLLLLAVTFFSCENELDLPGEASISDVTPPVASFTFTNGESVDDFLDFRFANLSTGATTFNWDFGDGTMSTDFEPTHTYPTEGTYTIRLDISDNLGVTSTLEETFDLIEPEVPDAITPVILEAGFEVLSLPDGTGDGRDSWRNSSLGGVIQINTSSSVPAGEKAAKLPADGSRIGYQELTVTPNTNYVINYQYRLEGPGGTCTVAILEGGGHTDLGATSDAIIESFTGSSEEYLPVNILFNSGANDTVSILFSNTGVEARLDEFNAFLN